MKSLKNGLLTGLVLQLGIGPVFFYIINLALQTNFSNAFGGVVGVTLGDYFYITLSILGIGKLLESPKVKKFFGIFSSFVLILFGIYILYGARLISANSALIQSTNPLTSLVTVFMLTVSSPLTIILFTSLFASKAVENNYSQKELILFGIGTGASTFIFMFISAIIFSLVKGSIPTIVIQLLNIVVGALLIAYAALRMIKIKFN